MRSLSVFDKLIWLSFALIGALLLVRMMGSGTNRYLFLIWNIFLAWLPYVFSNFLPRYLNKANWKQWMLLASWLLFFPNALYIVTDLVHLRADTNIPWWYDTMLLFLSSITGLLLAFKSLFQVEHFLQQKFKSRDLRFVLPSLLFIGSFGVYLGRFERWNSWNIINQPLGLFENILQCFLNPVQNWRVWCITTVFSLVYSMLFYSMRLLPAAMNKKIPGAD